jgi:hypothetical protein
VWLIANGWMAWWAFFYFLPLWNQDVGGYLFIYPIWADLFMMMDDGGSKAGMEPGWGRRKRDLDWASTSLPTYLLRYLCYE